MHTQKRFFHIRSRLRTYRLAKLLFPNRQASLSFPEEKLLRARKAFVLHQYKNRKSCSCAMCCNPRRSPLHKGEDRLTLQERKNLFSYREQLAALE